MTEAMRNRLASVLENTHEPVTGLSFADLGIVKGIKFDAISEKFIVYLDMQRVAMMTGIFFVMTGSIELEDLFTQALKKAFPQYTIRYFYVGRNRKNKRLLRVAR
jgi:hypothetical protein